MKMIFPHKVSQDLGSSWHEHWHKFYSLISSDKNVLTHINLRLFTLSLSFIIFKKKATGQYTSRKLERLSLKNQQTLMKGLPTQKGNVLTVFKNSNHTFQHFYHVAK